MAKMTGRAGGRHSGETGIKVGEVKVSDPKKEVAPDNRRVLFTARTNFFSKRNTSIKFSK